MSSLAISACQKVCNTLWRKELLAKRKNCRKERKEEAWAKQETKLGDSLKHFIKLPPSVCCYAETTTVFSRNTIFFRFLGSEYRPHDPTHHPNTLVVSHRKKKEKTWGENIPAIFFYYIASVVGSSQTFLPVVFVWGFYLKHFVATASFEVKVPNHETSHISLCLVWNIELNCNFAVCRGVAVVCL